VTGLAITPDGRTLLVSAMDGRVRLHDLNARRQRAAVLAHKGGVWALALSGDGRSFLTGGADQVVRVWDLARVKEVQTYQGHTRPVSAVALSANGRLAASGDYAGAVHLWSTTTGAVRFRKAVNKNWVKGVAFSPDGQLLAAGGREEAPIPGYGGFTRPSQLCLWRVADGARKVFTEPAVAVTFLPGQGGLVASCRTLIVDRDATGRTSISSGAQTLLWDPWRRRRSFAVKDHYHPMAISADGRYLATSGTTAEDGSARGLYLWELASGKEVWVRPVKEDDATVMAWTLDSRTLIAGRRRGTLHYHDLRPEGWQPPAQWGKADFARAWQVLGGNSPALAYRAVWDLAACGDRAVGWLRKTWKPRSQEERARRLLANLDSDEFAVREKARHELEELAEEAQSVLDAALEKPASLELKRAVERLLARLEGPASPAHLRQLRMLTVVERIGTPQARQFLHDLARGPAGASLREQARLAEARLAVRALR
jgi:hypothetical protein